MDTKIFTDSEITESLINNLSCALIIINEKNKIIKINEQTKFLFHLKEEELPNLNIKKILPGYNRESNYFNHSLNNYNFPQHLSINQFDISKNKKESGKLILINDITKEKILDEILYRYEFLFDTTRELMCLIKKDYKCAVVNKAFCNFFNIEKNKILNKKITKIFENKNFKNKIRNYIDECIQGKEIHKQEWYDFKEIGQKFLTTSYYPYFDTSNKIQYSILIINDSTELKKGQDILEESHIALEMKIMEKTDELNKTIKNLKKEIISRKNAESQIKKRSEENSQLFNSIKTILISFDKKMLINHFNPTAEKLFNVNSEKAYGKKIDELDINWDWKIINTALEICKKQKKIKRIDDIKLHMKSGKYIILGLYINPIMGEEKKIKGYVLWGADITDRKILESQLTQAQKLESIGQLAAGIAHEINTPIQYISDNIYFLKQNYHKLINLIKTYKKTYINKCINSQILEIEKHIDFEYITKEIPKAIDQSLEGVERVAKIVKSMRDFSHPMMDEKKLTDINKAIESTLTISRNEWKYVADVKTVFDKNLPLIPCFTGELNQAVLNIIINASQAIAEKIGNNPEKKGKISVVTALNDDIIEIRISDNGCGISNKIKSKIFDPFFTTKDVGVGTGQGLSIVHNVIVKKHNGKIIVETEQGKGTTFLIKLPIS